jgi:GTPase SAR1 family protein
MPFAQLVIGPPGSGKSTYCNGMHQFMSAIGRKCSVVNLDPANDATSYTPAVDVRELVTLEEIMAEDALGPNGAVLYALEEIEQNFEWLAERLKGLGGMLKTTQERECGLIVGVLEDYVLFDCPGQVEIFTHHSSLRNIFFKLQKLGYRVRAHFPEQEFPRHG